MTFVIIFESSQVTACNLSKGRKTDHLETIHLQKMYRDEFLQKFAKIRLDTFFTDV